MDATRWTEGNALTVDEMARRMWEPMPADAAGAMVLAGAPMNVRLLQIGNRNLDLYTNNYISKNSQIVLTDFYYQSWFCKYILARWKRFGFLERWLPVL